MGWGNCGHAGVSEVLAGESGQRSRGPAGKAVLGWPRVSARGRHELSRRRGTGAWQGHRVWMEIRIPTPHLGHSLGLPAMSAA